MQSQWAAKRKFIYGSIFLSITGLIILCVGLFFFYRTPTCNDGVLNQGEKDVDCGGPCVRLCQIDIAKPIVRWQRAFEVRPGFYSVAAYIQNPNMTAFTDRVGYTFRVYDAKNMLIAERKGATFIPVNSTFAIFESEILTGDRIPTRTDFQFDVPAWKQYAQAQVATPVTVDRNVLSDLATLPRLQSTLTNTSDYLLPKTEAVAILYNDQDIAVGASRTVLDAIGPRQSVMANFTWPQAFQTAVIRAEVLPRTYPQSALQ